MTKLEFLKKVHQEWADRAGYKLEMQKTTNELWIKTESGTFTNVYLTYLRHQDIYYRIDFNNKALRIHEFEYNMQAKQ